LRQPLRGKHAKVPAAVDQRVEQGGIGVLALPDTSMADYIAAEQAAERLCDGYADYFTRFDLRRRLVR
jgi:hypothetical protein